MNSDPTMLYSINDNNASDVPEKEVVSFCNDSNDREIDSKFVKTNVESEEAAYPPHSTIGKAIYELKLQCQCSKEDDKLVHNVTQDFIKGIPAALKVMDEHSLLDTESTTYLTEYLICRLLEQLPLSPIKSIEEAPNEWTKHTTKSNSNDNCRPCVHYQNNRCSSVFCDDDGTYTDINGPSFRDHTHLRRGTCFTGSLCHDDVGKIFHTSLQYMNLLPYKTSHTVTMPYMPKLHNQYNIFDREWFDQSTYSAYESILGNFKNSDSNPIPKISETTQEELARIIPIWVNYDHDEIGHSFMGFELITRSQSLSLNHYLIGCTIDDRAVKYNDPAELFESMAFKFYDRYISGLLKNDILSNWWLTKQCHSDTQFMTTPYPLNWIAPIVNTHDKMTKEQSEVNAFLHTTYHCIAINSLVQMDRIIKAESIDSPNLCNHKEVVKVLTSLATWEKEANSKRQEAYENLRGSLSL